MDDGDPLRVALLRLSATDQPAEKLSDLAAEALTRDLDSPALRELAGAPRDDYDNNRRLFVEAMRELGVDAPPRDAALRELVRLWASEIVAGAMDPYVGACKIWHEA